MQRRRAETLETLTAALRRMRPDYYVHVSVELLRELAGAQLELLELNFRRLFCAQLPPPPPYPYATYQYAYPMHHVSHMSGAPRHHQNNIDAMGVAASECDIAAAAGLGPTPQAGMTAHQAHAAHAAASHALNKLRAFADVKDR